MNETQLATTDQKQVEPSPKRAPREIRVVEDTSAEAYLWDTARFEHMFRIAGAMAAATLIPDHLWKSKSEQFSPEQVRSNCFLIVNQSVRWGMDPFAVMPETYCVGGKLGFQGKLVAAVVNARAGLRERLKYTFTGTGDNLTVEVSGTFKNEEIPRTVSVRVGDVKTDNKMWRTDPEQKLIYTGATKWARRHCPEIILGVLTDDDLDKIRSEEAKPANARTVPEIEAPANPVSPLEELRNLIKLSGVTESQTCSFMRAKTLDEIDPDELAALIASWSDRVAGIGEEGV